ncbi:major facilitator superfamily domain-containing protein [Sparassis latifolia]
MLLFFFLNLNPHQGKPLRQHVREFDFVGLILIIGGVVLLLIGFNFGEQGWDQARTIAPLVLGVCLLIAAGVNEIFTNRSPIVPPRLFKTRTTTFLLVSTFIHAIAFFCGTFYLPVYFQVLGSSATMAGVRMLPYSLGSSFFSILSGQVVTRTGRWRPVLWVAWGIFTLGYGLMIMLKADANVAMQVLYPLIAASGFGNLFQTPLIGLQAAMPIKDMATSTATFGFFRMLGGTIGVTVGDTILSGILQKKVKNIAGLSIDTSAAALNQYVPFIKHLPDSQRVPLIAAYCQAISTIWVVNTPLVGFGFILVLFVRGYSLKRVIVKAGPQGQEDAIPADVEKGEIEQVAVDAITAPDGEALDEDGQARSSMSQDDTRMNGQLRAI